MEHERRKFPWKTVTWLAIAALSVVWWNIAGQHNVSRLVLLIGLSLSSFMVGCLVGFIFTSYGEEAGTVGKIRDWLIAGMTGITIAKASAVKDFLFTFAVQPGPNEFALISSVAISYAGLGFFFMFFQRELIFNVLLAESRAERGRVEGTKEAGQVILRLLGALPASLLSGIDDIDDLLESRKEEAEKLKSLLYSENVEKFLNETDRAVKSGTADWDTVSKAAVLHYYRTYFEKDERKINQGEIAATWILRALAMNPLHVDLTLKYADTLGIVKRYGEAIIILERLESTPDAPAYVKQWLGYFLLFVPSREDEAIRYSKQYHEMFPDESDALLNIACAYAQKHCASIRSGASKTAVDSNDRRLALANLRDGLAEDPDFAQTIREKLIKPGESFACFAEDPEFRNLVNLPVVSAQ
jgi:tetratricopeptide (TPR) repeat protein